jgi:hypothetical protein
MLNGQEYIGTRSEINRAIGALTQIAIRAVLMGGPNAELFISLGHFSECFDA